MLEQRGRARGSGVDDECMHLVALARQSLGRVETVRKKGIYCSTLLLDAYEQGSGIR